MKKYNKKSSLSRSTKSKQHGGVPKSVGTPNRLPPVEDQLVVGKTLRFITTSNFTGSLSVSFTNLLDSWLVAGTATNGYQLFDFVRVRRVTVRAVAGSPQGTAFGATANVGIEFPGLVVGLGGSGRQIEDAALGTATVAMVCLSPGKDSHAGMWQASNDANAFVVRAVDYAGVAIKGAIIDVELSFKNSADVGPAAVAAAIAGATSGDLYYGGLDGGRLIATAAYSAFQRRI